MGYTRHHAILITGQGEHIASAHEVAQVIFAPDSGLYGPAAPVTPLTEEVINGYQSFAILADGSKDGWDASNLGDEARDKLIAWLREDDYCSWAEVQYGDEESENEVLRHDHDDEWKAEDRWIY